MVADELESLAAAQEVGVGVDGAPGRVEHAREGLLNVGAGVTDRAPLEVGQTSVVAQGGDDLSKRNFVSINSPVLRETILDESCYWAM